MRLTLIQTDIEWAAPEANLQRLEQRLATATQSDLYLLPEMFATGFCTSPDGIAEEAEQGTVYQWMTRWARQLNSAIAGSVAVRERDGSCRNRLYFIKPDGEVHYDKHHLFTYGREHEGYLAGDKRVIVEWRGVRFLLQVCYDLRFPIWARWSRNSPFDAIIYVASWPDTRMVVWNTLLRARAIENQCYVLGVNRIGTDPYCRYTGGSMLVDAYGKATEAASGESSLTATLDLEKLRAFRKKFPVLADRDPF
ncbi:MAG: amidohydrolase [Prevotellaceae bacterium]|nr:amidohydrolase [Prevotellaceae bacterium]